MSSPFFLKTHTFECHWDCFPTEVGPMTSFLPVESDENMDRDFSIIQETLNSTFLCLFLERLQSCHHFECFSSNPLLLFWRMREGLFEEMKWLGQVCCNICVPKALLLSTMFTSQAVHYSLSSTKQSTKAYLLSFKFYLLQIDFFFDIVVSAIPLLFARPFHPLWNDDNIYSLLNVFSRLCINCALSYSSMFDRIAHTFQWFGLFINDVINIINLKVQIFHVTSYE